MKWNYKKIGTPEHAKEWRRIWFEQNPNNACRLMRGQVAFKGTAAQANKVTHKYLIEIGETS